MNCLSLALKNGHYPRTMKVSKKQAEGIVKHFYTDWQAPLRSFSDLSIYDAYFYAYYTTKTGKDRKCFILVRK